MKYLVIVAFIAIIGSLAAALVYMMRGGSATEADGTAIAHDLAPDAAAGVIGRAMSTCRSSPVFTWARSPLSRG